MDVFVNVVGQKLKIATNQKRFVVGTQNFVRFVFGLSDEWVGLDSSAQFKQNGILYNKTIDDENATYLPEYIMPGEFTLSLQGKGSGIVAKTFEIRLLAIKERSSAHENGGSGGNEGNGGTGDENATTTIIDVATVEEVKNYLRI